MILNEILKFTLKKNGFNKKINQGMMKFFKILDEKKLF